MRKADATTELDTIKKDYEATLKETAFGIILLGDPAEMEKFAKFCADECHTLNVAADGFYDRICESVEPSIGDRKTFGTSQLGLMIRALDTIGRELGARNIPLPQIDDLVHVKNREELRAYVRHLIRKTGIGDTLNAAWIQKETTKRALEIRYSRPVVPVVLTGATEEEASTLQSTLFSGTSFIVPVNKENSDPDSILKCLGEIRTKLKKTPNAVNPVNNATNPQQ